MSDERNPTTLTSVCEIIVTGPASGVGEWTPESWAENVQDLIEDALGFPITLAIAVKTLSLELK